MKEIDFEKLKQLAEEIQQYTIEEHKQWLHKKPVSNCPLCN